MQYPSSPRRAGFTLTELSIVISIIALIVGGVLTGKHLVDAAKMNKTIEDFEYYTSITRNFQQKFTALPGDMADATRYFGRDTDVAVSADCLQGTTDVNSSVDGTCNGGNDGHIGYSHLAAGATNTLQRNLEYNNWAQHLALSGFTTSSYTGYAGWIAAGNISVAGGTHPTGSLEQSIIWAGYLPVATTGVFTSLEDKNILALESAGATINAYQSILSPEDLRNLDKKFDDGSPTRGKIATYAGDASPNCTLKANGASPTTTADTDATYNLSYKGVACVMLYVGGF